MKKYINKYSSIIAVLLLAIPMVFFGLNFSNNSAKELLNQDANDAQGSVLISETQMTQEQLSEVSDLVVIANLENIKEKTIKTIWTDPNDSESKASKDNNNIKIKAPVIIYNLKIEEFIQGELKTNTVDLVIPSIDNEFLNRLIEGESYKFYLEANSFYGDNAFNLVSFSQGFEELK